jgi:hypothetical protein
MMTVILIVGYCWWLHVTTELICDVVKDYYAWKANR